MKFVITSLHGETDLRLTFSHTLSKITRIGLVSSGASLTSWRKGVSLALVGHPFSDGATIKTPYDVDLSLHRPSSHPMNLRI